MHNFTDLTERRHEGAHGEGGERARNTSVEPNGSAPLSYAATCYQGSVEPIRRPDHKSKKHSRPAKWEDRHARRERQAREWAL